MMRIVFFGTSRFAAQVLSALVENGKDVVAVVTRPDRQKGRHLQSSAPPVKETAQQLTPKLPVYQPEKASAPEFASILQTYDADLFIVVAFGEIIKKNLLSMPKSACVNIHASLLPKFRGAAPIQRCLMAGEKETGITIIEMTPEMDAGDVIAKKGFEIPLDMTFGELEKKLCDLSCEMILEVIEQFQHHQVMRTPQDHSLATLAPKMTPEEERIDWKRPAQAIHNQIRSLSPFPGAWCPMRIGADVKRLKIKNSHVIPNLEGPPGSLLQFGKEGWIIACGEGALQLIQVQLEGKKAMSAQDCLRGIHQSVSMVG